MDYLTDTTFLIDLWRERAKPGAALRFSEAHAGLVVGMPWVVKAEFLRGAVLAGHDPQAVTPFLDAFVVAWPTESTLLRYAEIYARLRKAHAMIGPIDLWVAAAAVEAGVPLLTRNTREFEKVEGLRLEAYSG
jgi:tRNA(fMet)-specific endonuclease VapC